MSGLPRSMENHIHPFPVNINALWLVHEGVDVFCTLYLLGFQIHDMKQTVVGWITVRKESIIPHHKTSLPDIYSRINSGDIQHIRILQMNFTIFIRI